MYIHDRLANGIRVVSKEMPEMRSVSVGIWINTGSAYETQEENGISHLIEHMLFKGTKTKSAKDLADIIDGIGGQINAFTGKECTCYYVKVLDSHLEIGIDILSDMIINSKFDIEELEKEKKIIYDEIALYEDSPEDVAYEELAEIIFKNEGLGQPILGTEETLERLNSDTIVKYLKNHYIPKNMVISIAGSFDHSNMLTYLEESFSKISKGNIEESQNYKAVFNNGYSFKYKDIEQYHLCLGYKGVCYNNSDIYPLLVLNNLLGGGTSSRLFQNIREDQGLAYSIFSHPTQYKDLGLMTIYAGFVPKNLNKVIDSIKLEIANLKNNDIEESELSRAKEQLKGNYILGLESTGSIMSMLGKSLLLTNEIETLDEVIDSINSVKMEDINRMINLVFESNNFAVTLVGKVDKEVVEKVYKELL